MTFTRLSHSMFTRFAAAILIVTVLFAAVPVTPAYAADTGFQSPTGCANAGAGWTNPNNATEADNVYATTSNNNRAMVCSFNLPAIPEDSVITGIEVRIEGYASGSREAAVDLSWNGGGGYTGGDPNTTFTNTENAFTLGDIDEDWTRTWTNTDFTAGNFRVRLTSNNGSNTIYLDHVQVRVTYFAPLTIAASAGAGGSINPAGAVAVLYGANQSFSITPAAGYIVENVLVDAASQGRRNAYSFNNVIANHTIAASFDSGWFAPAANANANWQNPQYAYTSNSNTAPATAYAVADSTLDIVVYRDFNLGIPNGATITGIAVALEGYSTGSRELDVSLSWDGGANYTTALTTAFVDNGPEATLVLGGSNNTWGRSWVSSDFSNANFRLELDATFATGDTYLDQAQVKVYYTVISPTTLTVDAVTATYGNTAGLSATLTSGASGVNGQTIAFTVNGIPAGMAVTDASGLATIANYDLAGINAGTYATGIQASFAGNASYQASSGSAVLTINPRPASVTPNAAGKLYGDADPAFTGTLTGFLPADNVTATYARTPGETVAGSPYVISATLDPAGVLGNYAITYNTADFTIGLRAVTVTADAQGKVYGDPDPALTYQITSGSLAAGDAFSGALARDPGEDVGVYAINQGTLALNGNYVLTFVGANFTIGQRAVTITADVQVKVFGTPDPALTYQITSGSLAAGDAFSGALARDPGEDVGVYAINQGTLALNGNYDLTYIGANLTISGALSATAITGDTPDPSLVGENYLVTFTVVAATGSGTPTGNVTVSDGTDTCTATVAVGSCILASATPGAKTLVATYAGDGNFGPSASVGEDHAVHLAPAITSADNVTFNVGVADNFTVTVTGYPVPGLSVMGTLPAGVTFDPVTGLLAGTPEAGTDGIYPLTFTAANGVNPDAVQNFTLTINAAPAITSPNTTTFTVGQVGTFTVVAVGFPTPTLSMGGDPLPAGVSFDPLTGGLSGTPGAGTDGVYNLVFTASNGVGVDAVQNFTLVVLQSPPPMLVNNGLNTVSDTGDGHLDEMEIVQVKVSQFVITFTQDLRSVSAADAASVTNPNNFLLVRDNGDSIQTTSCASPVAGEDVQVTVDSVVYSNGGGSGPFVATLNLNGGQTLPNGVYRFFACGTTSIENLYGIKLAGDGINAGTDFVRNFVIAAAGNSGGDDDNDDSDTGKTPSYSGLVIPVTGFAPDVITTLPSQPAAKMYAAYSDLVLEIPRLGTKVSIFGIPQTKGGWDVTWLGTQAGYLEGSAFPTLVGNSVITAHVWNADNTHGPFYGLKNLRYGDKIIIRAWGKIFTYEVRSQSRLLPTALATLMKKETYSWITLVTCENYNEKTGNYAYRRAVRAVLVSVEYEK